MEENRKSLLVNVAKKIEQFDNDNIIHCSVKNNEIIATFTTRKEIEINVFTPYEIKQIEKNQFSMEDITRKIFELKQIASFS